MPRSTRWRPSHWSGASRAKRENLIADRVEKVAEAAVGAVLLGLAVYLTFSSVRALGFQAHPGASVASVVLLLFSLAVHIGPRSN